MGLLPTNNRYLRFFSVAGIAAQIADSQGRILYRAKDAPHLTPEQMRASAQGDVDLSADLRLRSAPVRDGRVYWVEDMTQINQLKAQLEELHTRLAEENELIRAEAELRRQQAQVEEKKRLFDRLSAILRPRLERMDKLLAGGREQDLQLVCMLGAYVKRRGNLALICEEDAPVSVDELAYCIRESLIYLDASGVVCALHQEGRGHAGGACLQTAYDFFEDCLEAALPTLSALMVRVTCGSGLAIRLMLEDAAQLPDMRQYAEAGCLTVDRTDGGCCLTLDFSEGGVRS